MADHQLTPTMRAALLMLATTRSFYQVRAGWTDGVTTHRVQTIRALKDRGLAKSDFHGVWLTIEGKRLAAELKEQP